MSLKKTPFIAVVVAALLLSCGPSLRRTYESDNAFARCFDMDYNPGKDAGEKRICWQAWLDERVFNQPADKIRYAKLRLDELGKGISIPGPPGEAGSFDQRPTPKKESAPPSKAAVQQPPQTTSPTETCEKNCRGSFSACRASCESDGGVNMGCAETCDSGYKACMKSCFN